MFYFLVRDYELTRNESTTVNAFFLVIENFTATQATWKLSRFFVIPILTGQENKQSPIEPSKSRMINAFGKLKKKKQKKRACDSLVLARVSYLPISFISVAI